MMAAPALAATIPRFRMLPPFAGGECTEETPGLVTCA
jgi:hypothetical protein